MRASLKVSRNEPRRFPLFPKGEGACIDVPADLDAKREASLLNWF